MSELSSLAIQTLNDFNPEKTFDWRSIAFDKQIKFIEDPSRLKCIFTTRRAGKTGSDAIALIKAGFETPRCNLLFLGLTRLSAKGIIWKDYIEEFNNKYNLGLIPNLTEQKWTFPNGSVLHVAGVDVDENERKKLFGRKYKFVVIDEAALFGIDLRDLVYVVLRPAIADLRGTVVLSGMASNITRGLFYDITTGKEKGWSLHKWSAHDNPHVAKQWQEELDFIKNQQPHLLETARYRQAYLNEWVVDEEKLVYKFSEERIFIHLYLGWNRLDGPIYWESTLDGKMTTHLFSLPFIPIYLTFTSCEHLINQK